MSTKEWKNKELTSILSEAFGFKFSLDNLNEAKEADPKAFDTEETVSEDVGGAAGELTPEEAKDEDYVSTDEQDGNINEVSTDEEELEEGGLADRPENDDKVKPHRGRRGKGAVSEDQIREVARRILARMQKEEKNG